jgi:hypothetical protein
MEINTMAAFVAVNFAITTQDAANIATVAGTGIGIISLLAIVVQMYLARQISNGEFLLTLEERFRDHLEIRARLDPDLGSWRGKSLDTLSAIEHAEIEDYLAFFEHCEVLIRAKALGKNEFNDLFGFYFREVFCRESMTYKKVYECDNIEDWGLLIALKRRCEL